MIGIELEFGLVSMVKAMTPPRAVFIRLPRPRINNVAYSSPVARKGLEGRKTFKVSPDDENVHEICHNGSLDTEIVRNTSRTRYFAALLRGVSSCHTRHGSSSPSLVPRPLHWSAPDRRSVVGHTGLSPVPRQTLTLLSPL
jgi:hypothetical protein